MTTALIQHAFHGQAVRVLTDEHGEPWFVAADVTKILGYEHAPSAVRRLDEDEHRQVPFSQVAPNVRTPAGQPPHRPMTVVSESGLYSLILWSQKTEAVAFRRWLTTEVLPTIRRTGSYGVPALTGPELMARALIEAHSAMQAHEQRIAELEPPAKAWQALADASGDYSLRDAAQVLSRDPDIEIGQNRLARLLRDLRWIDSHGVPYQAQIIAGRVAARARTYTHPRTGERVQADPQVRITAKGLTWLHQHLGGTAPLDATDRHLEIVS